MKKEIENTQPTADAQGADVTEELVAVLEEIVDEPANEKKKGEAVSFIDESNFLVGERHYRLVADHRDGFDVEKFVERYSDVLSRYDYIVGDWGYEQLRLKGFFRDDNRKVPAEQRIDTLEDYLYEFCNFGCAYFVLERIGGKKEKRQNRRRRKKPQTTQAHVEEKKAPVTKNKPKPVIKNRKPKDAGQEKNKRPVKKAPKEIKAETKAETKKSGFTIRKREE